MTKAMLFATYLIACKSILIAAVVIGWHHRREFKSVFTNPLWLLIEWAVFKMRATSQRKRLLRRVMAYLLATHLALNDGQAYSTNLTSMEKGLFFRLFGQEPKVSPEIGDVVEVDSQLQATWEIIRHLRQTPLPRSTPISGIVYQADKCIDASTAVKMYEIGLELAYKPGYLTDSQYNYRKKGLRNDYDEVQFPLALPRYVAKSEASSPIGVN